MNRLILCKAVAALGFMLAACSTQPVRTVFVQEPLPLPDRPNVPTIAAAELSCLSDEAYLKLVERDQVQFEHIVRLESIIMSTHR